MTTSVTKIDRMLVVGAGAMGSQIAMLGALAGIETALYDVRAEQLSAAHEQLRRRVDRSVQRGKLTAEDADQAFARLRLTNSLEEAASGTQLVIEAIVENLDAKVSLFTELQQHVADDTIFATNSSSIVGSLIGERIGRSRLVCNAHFFNPPLVMECVEIVGGPDTDPAAIEAVRDVCERMGKTPVILEREIPGFVANRIVSAIFREAISLLEGGYASVEAIDEICRSALRHPMGPFELLDFAGIDVNKQMQDLLYLQSGDPEDQPPQTIVRMVADNRLGRKTGTGFYAYEGDTNVGIAS